jgi:hypothetical protein
MGFDMQLFRLGPHFLIADRDVPSEVRGYCSLPDPTKHQTGA